MGILGDVDADSIAALQFSPGKPRVTVEEGQARFPGSIVTLALLKWSKIEKSRNDTMLMFVSIDHVYRTNTYFIVIATSPMGLFRNNYLNY